MRNLRNSKGFTLIELMIVVVIIGILAAIAIPKFTQVSKDAKEAEAGPIMKQICTLASVYEQKEGVPAGNLNDLATVGWDAVTAEYYTFAFNGTQAQATPITAGEVEADSLTCG